jgi:drug/metabolite transporter (DMT)-like permease
LDLVVFSAVIIAAFLHASWNVLVKINVDRFLALFLIHVLMGFFGIAMVLYAGLPIGRSWSYALLSGVLHTGYNLLLARSYRHGEMSLVYPVARGAAPLVSLALSLFFAGDHISWGGLCALGVLIAGLWLVALGRTARIATDRVTIAYAFGTAIFIGLYTVVDGMGARVSGNALAYAGLVFALDGVFLLIAGLALRGPQIIRQVVPFFWRGAAGSVFSSVSYGLVIWAMTKAPIGMVAALRESSILFVLGMSAIVLNEKLTPMRIAGGALIVTGAAALRFV